MRTLVIIAAVLVAQPAIAQPKRSPAACATVQEVEQMKEMRIDAFQMALSHMNAIKQTQRDATVAAQHKFFDACMDSGAEKPFCTRIALAPDIDQIRAECEADGEDPDACEQSAELPQR